MANRDYSAEYEKRKQKLKRVPLDMQIADYEEMKAHTEDTKETISSFIKRAIFETMEKDKNDYWKK